MQELVQQSASTEHDAPVGPQQTPPEQLLPVGHTVPHEPQFVGSVNGSTQALPQVILPAPQTHEPLTHEPAPQLCPQVPQFAGSDATSAQPLKHLTLPPAHEHAPPEHASPVLQLLPQPPQFAGSDERSAQTVPHFTRGDAHPGSVSVPLPVSAPAPVSSFLVVSGPPSSTLSVTVVSVGDGPASSANSASG
jgi:hypothetical protein